MLETLPDNAEGRLRPTLVEVGQIPLYLQIADHLRQRIKRGTWTQGLTIPSLDALALEFGVARVTMRQAVQLLTRENLVVPRRGVGTIVREHGVFQKVSLQTSLHDLAQDYEHIAPVLLMFDGNGRRPLLPASEGPLKDKYVYMQRLHLVEGEPCAVISLYLAEDLYRRAPKRFRERAVISVLAELNAVDIHDARQTLTIDSANAETSRLLKVPSNAPVGRVERIFRDAEGEVVYAAELVYRGDWVKWEVDLQQPWRNANPKTKTSDQ